MSEQADVISQLDEDSVLTAIRWAYTSAVDRAMTDWSEDAGYDTGWLGQTRHVLFRDRLDRVFSCGRYGLADGTDETAGLDSVRAELTARDIATMPRIASGQVRRADLNRSPGWVCGDVRFLLASAAIDKIASLPWPQRSPTKQRIAMQPTPEPPPMLFDHLVPEEVGGLLALAAISPLDLRTYVVAHSLDWMSQRHELVFGRPQMNRGGGPAWHWYEDLLALVPGPGSRLSVETIDTPPADRVPDAAVRLRRRAAENAPTNGAGGSQL